MNFTYKIIYSRRKSVGIVVNSDKTITVRAPYFSSEKSITKLLASKAEWIERHINNQSDRTMISPKDGYVQGAKLLFLGKTYVLSVLRSTSNSVNITDGIIEVITKSTDEEKVKLILDRWYKKQASEIFKTKMDELIAIQGSFGFKPTALSVRSMKSRWGSCGRSGRITLNTELVKLDPKYTEYVILHELCHLKEMNHGKGFYDLLDKVCPNYRSIRRELRQFRLW